MTPALEIASSADLNVIRALLSESDLPIDDIDQHVAQFVLAKWEGVTIGTVAVEYAGEAALLRSLCVGGRYRGQAVGTQLLAAIEHEATSRGVRDFYLLTTNSAGFFERHGFSRISRAVAPPRIRGTAQFLTLCPAAAVCMYKSLSTSRGGFPDRFELAQGELSKASPGARNANIDVHAGLYFPKGLGDRGRQRRGSMSCLLAETVVKPR